MICLETEQRLAGIRKILGSLPSVDPHELATSYVQYVETCRSLGLIPDSLASFAYTRYER